MKNTILIISSFVSLILLTSCGGGPTGTKSVDIPPYALGEGGYFADRETKTAHAWWGKADVNWGQKKFGDYIHSSLTGLLVETDGEQFLMLQDGGSLSLTNYLFNEGHIYSVQLLRHDFKPENPINSALAANDHRGKGYVPIENDYCESYYFYEDERLAEAREWIETLDKQPNQASQYDAKAVGGVKTYKAKIGKAVVYFGADGLKPDRFLSLYLDCGAVVELRAKTYWEPKEIVGKTIDCVTDDANRVIEHEIIKNN